MLSIRHLTNRTTIERSSATAESPATATHARIACLPVIMTKLLNVNEFLLSSKSSRRSNVLSKVPLSALLSSCVDLRHCFRCPHQHADEWASGGRERALVRCCRRCANVADSLITRMVSDPFPSHFLLQSSFSYALGGGASPSWGRYGILGKPPAVNSVVQLQHGFKPSSYPVNT